MPTTDQTGLINQVPTPIVQAPSYAPGAPQIIGAQAQQATTTKYDPVGFSVDQNQTVAGNIEGIIAKDSPLMQQAATRAKQYANSRGLINSGLAAQAGQEAVIAAATPIAQQDASTYSQAHTNTQNAKNASLQFGAQAENTTSQTNAQLGTNVSMENAQATNAASLEQFKAGQTNSLAEFDARTKLALAQVDANTRTQLATIDGNYRQLLQTNQDAASAFNQVAQNIANISQNATMSEQAKRDAIATQMNSLHQLLQQQAQVASTSTGAIGELNLGSYWGGGNFQYESSLPGSTEGGGATPIHPGSQVTAFGRPATIGPGQAPSGTTDTTQYEASRAHNYPYWMGSDGFAYPTSVAPGAWPPGSFSNSTSNPGIAATRPPQFTENPAIPGQYTRQVPIPTQSQAWMPYTGEQQYLTEEYGRGFLANGGYYPTPEAALAAMEAQWNREHGY